MFASPAKPEGTQAHVVSVFEAIRRPPNNKISDAEFKAVEKWWRFPGPGSCGGMYTANTMASASTPSA